MEGRTLYLYADDEEVADGLRMHVFGKSTMSLIPDQWQIDIWNLDDDTYGVLKSSSKITVKDQYGGCICDGRPSDVLNRVVSGREVTSVFIFDGESFWHSFSSFSVSKGTTIEKAIRELVYRSESDIPVVMDEKIETRIQRGQTFFGRTAKYIDELTESCGMRAFITRETLFIISSKNGLTGCSLNQDDILDGPYTMENAITYKTDVKGYTVGQIINVEDNEIVDQYVLVSYTVDADTQSGNWFSYLVLVKDETSWEGGL